MLIEKLRISNFAGQKTPLALDKETLFCGHSTGWQVIKNSLLQIFEKCTEQNDLTICADFVFPETDSPEIPELFHHLKADENGKLHCSLELTIRKEANRIQREFNWLLPHGVKRPVKIQEQTEFVLLYLSADICSWETAVRKIISRILSAAGDPDFSIAEFCEETGLENFAQFLTASENLAASAEEYSRQLVALQRLTTENIQTLLVKLLVFAGKRNLLPWYTLLLADDPLSDPEFFRQELLNSLPSVQTLFFSKNANLCRYFPLTQIRRLTPDSAIQLSLPETEINYIKEAVNSFPELLTASMIILTSSVSESIILEKFARLSGIDPVRENIVFVPLASDAAASLQMISEQLQIPCLTLLDLHHQHPGGDWERIAAILDAGKRAGRLIPAAEGTNEPIDTALLRQSTVDLNNEMIWLDWLQENWNIFVSSPQNLDHLMFQTFLPEYRKLFAQIDYESDESFFQQLFSSSNPAFIHTMLFSSIPDETIFQNIPEFITNIMKRIKDLQELSR